MSRRFSARILNKQKSSDNKEQDIMDKAMEKKKKDLEMLPISKSLTPVAQAVTDRLYNEAKISKGGPVKKSNSKTTTKATCFLAILFSFDVFHTQMLLLS